MKTNITGTTGNISVHYKTNRVKIITTHDRVTEENCLALRADPEALRTTARLFKTRGTPVGQILNLFGTTRTNLSKLGLKVFTGGYVTRATELDTARAIFEESDDELERLRGEVRRQYTELVYEGKKRLGDSAEGIQWPSVAEVSSGWKHRFYFLPDPTSGGALLEGVSDEAAAKTRAEVKRSQQIMLESAHSDLIRELLGYIIGNGKSDHGILGVLSSDCVLKKGRFENLKERLQQAKEMNWIELPQLDAAIRQLEPIASADLDELRANDYKRKELEQTAQKAVDSVTQNSLASLGIGI